MSLDPSVGLLLGAFSLNRILETVGALLILTSLLGVWGTVSGQSLPEPGITSLQGANVPKPLPDRHPGRQLMLVGIGIGTMGHVGGINPFLGAQVILIPTSNPNRIGFAIMSDADVAYLGPNSRYNSVGIGIGLTSASRKGQYFVKLAKHSLISDRPSLEAHTYRSFLLKQSRISLAYRFGLGWFAGETGTPFFAKLGLTLRFSVMPDR